MPTTAAGGGALAATNRIVNAVIAECGRCAETTTVLSDQLSDQTERMVAVLGGGPPHDAQEAIRRTLAATQRLDQARAALVESAQALHAFLAHRT